MLPGVGVALVGLVAVEAADPDLGVAAVPPLADGAGVFFGVTIDAPFVLRRNDGLRLTLRHEALAFDEPHHQKGGEKEQTQDGHDPLLHLKFHATSSPFIGLRGPQ